VINKTKHIKKFNYEISKIYFAQNITYLLMVVPGKTNTGCCCFCCEICKLCYATYFYCL